MEQVKKKTHQGSKVITTTFYCKGKLYLNCSKKLKLESMVDINNQNLYICNEHSITCSFKEITNDDNAGDDNFELKKKFFC